MKTNELIHSVIFAVALSGTAMADEQTKTPAPDVAAPVVQVVEPELATDLDQLLDTIKQELLSGIKQQVNTSLSSLATTVKNVIQE